MAALLVQSHAWAASAGEAWKAVNAAIGRDGGLDQARRVIGTADIGSVSRNLGTGRAQSRFRFSQLAGRARRQHNRHPSAMRVQSAPRLAGY
jgi:hypothetical protein